MDPVSHLELSNFAIMPSNCFFIIKSPGNVMNCPEKKIDPPHPGGGGGGGVGGSTFQKSGKFHELPRKSINIFLPLPR